ncbi:MAG: HAD-IA family hydrolase [Acidobacteriota bacterium]
MEENRKGHLEEGAGATGAVALICAPKLLIFDLDGTLIDSKEDLIASVNATREYMKRDQLPGALVASYVGNGAPVLIRRAMGAEASEAEVEEALDYFIRHYHEHCLDRTRLYPGTRETMERAREKGIHLAVLTNKPVKISHVILGGLGVDSWFARIYGGNSFAAKKPDPVGIHTLREELTVEALATVMIGDSRVDIETARNAGVYSVGLTYGLQPESLREVPPDLLLDRMEDLIPHL